ncbi:MULTISPECIES: hypothetical protein [unclassified Duganella]|uniref:hypothetical protein n=1 Tax=unclassified Duganella TaxID=2636909 RepID=UPI001587EB33|nr:MULTISPECIES: hypothetical protein [unclassified Duganella]
MTWPRERLAHDLQSQARDNAALKRRVLELEVEVFWMKAAQAAPLASIDFGGARPRALPEVACWCATCRPVSLDDCRMVLCPTCGNKRCPRATDHRRACTGSNEPGQPGSAYQAWSAPTGGA